VDLYRSLSQIDEGPEAWLGTSKGTTRSLPGFGQNKEESSRFASEPYRDAATARRGRAASSLCCTSPVSKTSYITCMLRLQRLCGGDGDGRSFPTINDLAPPSYALSPSHFYIRVWEW
jgi:hypothetical protein